MPVHDFDPPDRFVAGTVGPPGQRVFFLQAASGRRIVSVSCEKEQVSILAERVEDVLDQYAAESASSGVEVDDNDPLATPIEDEFRVATLSLAWDPARSVVVIEAYDTDPTEPQDDPDSSVEAVEELELAAGSADHTAIRVALPPPAARAFVRRARALISAGRPPCPFCGGPLDQDGHICPRANGYRR